MTLEGTPPTGTARSVAATPNPHVTVRHVMQNPLAPAAARGHDTAVRATPHRVGEEPLDPVPTTRITLRSPAHIER